MRRDVIEYTKGICLALAAACLTLIASCAYDIVDGGRDAWCSTHWRFHGDHRRRARAPGAPPVKSETEWPNPAGH